MTKQKAIAAQILRGQNDEYGQGQYALQVITEKNGYYIYPYQSADPMEMLKSMFEYDGECLNTLDIDAILDRQNA
jgi:hypothetical protein